MSLCKGFDICFDFFVLRHPTVVVGGYYYNIMFNIISGIINRADDKCKAAFQSSYDTCKNSVHWAVNWALCWPMQVTFVCNLAPCEYNGFG